MSQLQQIKMSNTFCVLRSSSSGKAVKNLLLKIVACQACQACQAAKLKVTTTKPHIENRK